MTDLIELGAIEVADDYRSLGIGREMLLTALEDKYMEKYIIFTTEYYWHWDLKGSGLNVWDYRKMMERLMEIDRHDLVCNRRPRNLFTSCQLFDGTYRKSGAYHIGTVRSCTLPPSVHVLIQ